VSLRAPAPAPAPRPTRPRALGVTAGLLVMAFLLLSGMSTLWTEKLWFDSVDFESVFGTMLWTRVGLFLIFGAVMALTVGASMLIAYRARPLFRPSTPDQLGLARYRDAVVPVRTWLMGIFALVVGSFAGLSAAGQWRGYLLWRYGGSFGTEDPYFGRDAGFYVFDLPWWQFIVDFLMAVAVLSFLFALGVHYLFGGIRLQSSRDRLSPAAQVQLSVLLGIFVLLKGVDYWLGRYDVLSARGSLITGMNYTDEHAVVPAREILAGIAVICALLFFANIRQRTWRLPATGLALMFVSSVLLGLIWPGLLQQLSVNPSPGDKEAPYIARNMEATRLAYGIDSVETTEYAGKVAQDSRYRDIASQTSSLPIVDPLLVQRSFEQEQQIRAYYAVAPVLDVDRYLLDGRVRALALGVRELDQSGLDESSRNWSNLHTVYTHGNGVIAAYANQRPLDNKTQGGTVQWAEGQEAGERALSDLSPDGYEPRVYFGERSPSYSIVGKAPGGEDRELDVAGGGVAGTTTYEGQGGVEVGSLWRKVLFAMKFGEPKIVLSERVHENSKILFDRHPADMVRKTAPWLTLDSDPYPAVIDGKIVWILDGYTMTNKFPQAQLGSFASMTDDALTTPSGFQTLPTDEINYMRQAVKATVDAYDGTVTLYAWDEEDPILKAWRAAFPGVVKDRSEIPESLLAHLRYPEDLFKVQRYQFGRYHVDDAREYFEQSSRWQVSPDPEDKNRQQPPYRLFVDAAAGTGSVDPVWSMTSVFRPLKKDSGPEALVGFMSVDSDATDPENFGKLRLLEVPLADAPPGPSLVSNEMRSNESVRDEIFKFTSADIKPSYGNLLTIPVDDGFMYVQPLYAARDTSSSSPLILTFVLVYYDGKVGISETLDGALRQVLDVSSEETLPEGTDIPQGKLSPQVRRLLDQAVASYARADELQRKGDTAGWVAELEKAREFIDQAAALLDRPTEKD
jgi:uncharacterized membrane protein (UPF0182 family)